MGFCNTDRQLTALTNTPLEMDYPIVSITGQLKKKEEEII